MLKHTKTVAILLSILMVVLTLNVSTVSAYSNELSDNIQIADTAQVNIIDGNGNIVEQTTTQPTTVQETQPSTEEETQPPTQEVTEKATVKVNKNASNLTLDIAKGSLEFQFLGNLEYYKQGNGVWVICPEEITITGSTDKYTISVNSGIYNITLNQLNIDVSSKSDVCAFDIKSNSTVNLFLAKNSFNELRSGSNSAGLQVQSKDDITSKVNILGEGLLTAVGGEFGAGIGGAADIDTGTISISGNAQVTATGGFDAAGIGGGVYSDGGTVSISGDAQVTATAGLSNLNVPGIGSVLTKKASLISIGKNAKVIAVAYGDIAINSIDNTITKPLDEEVANVLELTYARTVYPNTKTVITTENAKVIEHLSETANYKSIAFSGLDLDTTYKVITGDNYQQGTLNSVTTDNFELSTTGITKYTKVQDTANQARKVTFKDSTNDAVIGEAYTVSGGTVQPPTLPLLRKEIYDPAFQDEELQNITEDTILTYDRVPKTFAISSGIMSEDINEVNNLTLSHTVADYDTIVSATYTGALDVKGWKINDKIVSVSNSKTYSFYINEVSIITPIFGNDITSVNINIGTVIASTETENVKLYYPIFTSGYEDGTNIRYGVIRSTTQADVTEAKIAEYLADDTKETNANIVKEYTDTNVMNGDGRYNYVAVMPKNTDKSLYMQAWIEVDGKLYLTTLNEQNMATIG